MSLTLSPDNDTTLLVKLQTMGPRGRLQAATGLAVAGFISASAARDATPLHASLSVTLVESPAGSGYYMGQLPGTAITAQWAGLTGASALSVHYVANTDDYHEVDTVLLAAVRRPDV